MQLIEKVKQRHRNFQTRFILIDIEVGGERGSANTTFFSWTLHLSSPFTSFWLWSSLIVFKQKSLRGTCQWHMRQVEVIDSIDVKGKTKQKSKNAKEPMAAPRVLIESNQMILLVETCILIVVLDIPLAVQTSLIMFSYALLKNLMQFLLPCSLDLNLSCFLGADKYAKHSYLFDCLVVSIYIFVEILISI